jgi:hypothetical protein
MVLPSGMIDAAPCVPGEEKPALDMAVDAPAEIPAEPTPPSIAELLTQARSAHSAYRAIANDRVRWRDLDAQDAYLSEERNARQAAHLLDPERLDPAWEADAAANQGQTSDAMLAFCEMALNQPDQP